MKILLLTQLFQPEPAHIRGLKFAKALIEAGNEVEVLTGFPNYPNGKIYQGYNIRLFQREIIDGVPIVRVALYPSHDQSGVRRFLCYVSFALMASLLGLFLMKRPDVVFICQGPATIVLPAMVFKWIVGAPYVLDVQDIWPESVTESGMFKANYLLPFLHAWCSLSYRFSEKIIVLSEGYKALLLKRGVRTKKIHVVYNWCDEELKHFHDGHDRFNLSGYFNIIYAGTMGKIQALEYVIDAASILQKEIPHVQFVFVGGGTEVDHLIKYAFAKNVNNVRFIPRQPINEIGGILALADILLIHLKDNPLGRIGIPQKTQAYMAAGKPILMAVAGDAASLVERADAGIVCKPEDPVSISNAIRKSLAQAPEELKIM